jgi:hypothetical protein
MSVVQKQKDLLEEAAVIAETQQQVGCDKWIQTEIAKKIRALK